MEINRIDESTKCVCRRFASAISLSLLIFLFLENSVLGSSEWIEYHADKEANVYLYNRVDIKHTNDFVQVWEKVVFSVEGRKEYVHNLKNLGWWIEGWDNLSYSLFLNEIDCKKGMSRILSGTDYDANSNPLGSISSDELKEWINIVPGSMMSTLRQQVCEQQVTGER